jgi:L-alanine-DL-glutamate epimerase-like enolase superfamily enzyme
VPGRAPQAPIFADGYADDLDSVDAEGCVPVPQGPGLGVTIDWDWLKTHASGSTVYAG